ncbi:MAG: ribbon-helix-helix domain-containing protein [Proteobacteria bacterium]|nr:ribbon-helix-helix domain-containing protein [Pseudomonadota bacterium]
MSGTLNIRGTDRLIKNLFVNGRRTSLRLEVAFWEGFEACAREQGKSLHQLANSALEAHADTTASLSRAVRLFVINYFRQKAEAAERGGRKATAQVARQASAGSAGLAMAQGQDFLAAVRNLGPRAVSDKGLLTLLVEIRDEIDRSIDRP